MPYRAPELFDVKNETTLDEKVDIWSLGCTLYAMAYGQSPFEAGMNEQGGSIALAVLNGQFRFPSDPELDQLYSQTVKDLISWLLIADPSTRPDIHQVGLAQIWLLDLTLLFCFVGHWKAGSNTGTWNDRRYCLIRLTWIPSPTNKNSSFVFILHDHKPHSLLVVLVLMFSLDIFNKCTFSMML